MTSGQNADSVCGTVQLLANVGDDSEGSETLAYVRDVLMPYAAALGVEYLELHRVKRDGSSETLLGRLTREGSRTLDIPVRMSNGAPGNRSCTRDFKIQVVAKWHKAHGATVEAPGVVGIGFSTDEIERAGKAQARPWRSSSTRYSNGVRHGAPV